MNIPRIRPELNVMPSPDPQNPGLYVTDTYRFTDAWLIIPEFLAQGLRFFDGLHTAEDLSAELSRLSGQPDMSAVAQQFIDGMDRSGFLENETFVQMRDARFRAFIESPTRTAVHAGSGYPNEPGELHNVLSGYLSGAAPSALPPLLGIAAPHVSPFGGWKSYASAYRNLTPDLKDRTFVILGTSHYGRPNRFGLTRKPFSTPYGVTSTDNALLDELAEQPAVVMEDYCHVIEHSIEFQVVFLQHLYGPDVKILPILCGSFGPSVYNGSKPEDDDDAVRRFFGTLGEIAARDADRLFWVLGVDMAHVGMRYGDQITALADQGEMLRVKERDYDRIASLNAGASDAFWDKIKENNDDLKWCGLSPFYTFMQVVPGARGTLQHYEQWNIDAQSIVSFSGITFASASELR